MLDEAHRSLSTVLVLSTVTEILEADIVLKGVVIKIYPHFIF